MYCGWLGRGSRRESPGRFLQNEHIWQRKGGKRALEIGRTPQSLSPQECHLSTSLVHRELYEANLPPRDTSDRGITAFVDTIQLRTCITADPAHLDKPFL